MWVKTRARATELFSKHPAAALACLTWQVFFNARRKVSRFCAAESQKKNPQRRHCFFSNDSYKRHAGTRTEPSLTTNIVIMKTLTSVSAIVLILVSATVTQAAIIANWTFEVNTPADLNNSTAGPAVSADVGSGTFSGLHASAASDWSTPLGNGSANSYSVNTWTSGDYFQIHISTIGLSGISLSWDQAGSSTGPRDFILQYSTDGSSFTSFGSTYAVGGDVNTWSSTVHRTGFDHSADLSSITALDNAPDVYFRLMNNSTVSVGAGTVAATGTGRIDDFTVTAVPEPTAWAEIIFGALFFGTQAVRKLCFRTRA